ncbi:hypothetical protein E1B28_006876 [Marasmius oreades]|uniref:Uncharacterized protein n=1 Tax=Marasmius oreades TaxID=181124 RepID=A0A9P7S141_9AGAR|nr:uncharacterized protein E1B28_006876 [Marasmius oreades]KAG7093187.1 hypothetical protein E1B28_006876 [Marasmius oreades]
MHIILRALFLYLLALSRSCVGFTFTLPPSPVFVGNVTDFRWNWNSSDFHHSLSGVFMAYLVVRPQDFQCPLRLDDPGLGIDTISKLFKTFATARNPINDTETSGNLILTPENIGPHFICSYGNVSTNDDGNFSPGTQQDGLIDLKAFFGSLVFLGQSNTFNVTAGTDPTTSTSSTSNAASLSTSNTASPSTSNATSPSPNTVSDGDRSHANDGHDNAPDIAPIVGGVVGGIALLCLILFLFWLKIQRKLKQFRKSGSGSTFSTYSDRPVLHTITPYDVGPMEAGTATRKAAGTPRVTHLRSGELARPVLSRPGYRDNHGQTLSTPVPVVDPPVSPPAAHEIEDSPTAVAVFSETPRSLGSPGPPDERGIREMNFSTEPQFTVRHADSGWRPANIPEPHYVDVPPDYDEAR